MIQNVEEFGAELGRKPFFYRPILEQGKIPIAEARIAENIPTRRSKSTGGRRDQYRTVLHKTTEIKQIKASRFGVAELKVPIPVACCVQTAGKPGLITCTVFVGSVGIRDRDVACNKRNWALRPEVKSPDSQDPNGPDSP